MSRPWTPPPRSFFIKSILFLVALAIAVPWSLAHYRIGYDPQTLRCLPYELYVIRLDDGTPQVGEIHAFATRGLMPHFKDGTRFIKTVAGVPGERVTVGRDTITVEGRTYRAPIVQRVLDKTHRTWSSVLRSYRLGSDEYLMLGTINTPYDSRYTGPVHRDQFRGKATPLW